jgi:phosphoglycerol transferase MdoB-like AlkP superfamily enzyme
MIGEFAADTLVAKRALLVHGTFSDKALKLLIDIVAGATLSALARSSSSLTFIGLGFQELLLLALLFNSRYVNVGNGKILKPEWLAAAFARQRRVVE